jgi:hypothetical protein
MDTYPAMLNKLFGTRMKVIGGYKSGTDIYLAMERGELDGRCGWSWGSIKVTRANWLRDKRLNLLVQIALQSTQELASVPLIMDRARTDRERQILRLLLSRQQMGWPFLAPPDLPKDRAQALRAAFEATMKDPDYLAETKQRKLEVNPMTGAAIDKLIAELYATPADAIAATKAAISEGAGK